MHVLGSFSPGRPCGSLAVAVPCSGLTTVAAGDSEDAASERSCRSGVGPLDLSGVRRFPPGQPAPSPSVTPPAPEAGDRSGSQTPFDGLSRLFAGSEESVSVANSIVSEVPRTYL